jgi:hypothetical protein
MAFKMKGHTLPGIKQRSEGNTDLKDGRSASAAFQYNSPLNRMKGKPEGKGGRAYDQPFAKYNSALKQTDDDLKEYLIDEKGFNQSDADQQIADGSYTVEDEGFLTWYKAKDVPAETTDEDTIEEGRV